MKKYISTIQIKLKNVEQELEKSRLDMNCAKDIFEDKRKKWKDKVNDLKCLKEELKEIKIELKKKKRVRKKSYNGFNKPVLVSENLKNFLKLTDYESTRNYIWNFIYDYIKTNNLVTDEDKRYFILEGEAGEYLCKSLNLNKSEKNSIYSIRKNIEMNIIKNTL
jgi:chromatin remodeling complex protein RSC6